MKGYSMHPSDKLLIKAIILIAIILALFAIFPMLAAIIVAIVSISFLYEEAAGYSKYLSSFPHKIVKVNYNKYLQSETWKIKKQAVLNRDSYQCQMCGRIHSLHVHHITYKNLGKEPLSDLVTLCSFCHKKVHDYHGKNAMFYPIL